MKHALGNVVQVWQPTSKIWLTGVIILIEPLTVQITEKHPVWHGAQLKRGDFARIRRT